MAKEIELDADRELNFREEEDNCEKARALFKGDDTVAIPRVYYSHCTDKVMTMSYMDGIPITNVAKLKAAHINLKDVARLLTEAYCKQIFQFGFVHADPHPGNILIQPIKKGNNVIPKIILLDHGLYEKFDDRSRGLYALLWLSIIKQQKQYIKKCVRELGAPMPKLFVSMLMNRRYEEVMDESLKYKLKSRLGNPSISVTRQR